MNQTGKTSLTNKSKKNILNILLALGFRPFFLLAGFSAVILIGLWLLILNDIFQLNTYFNSLMWHQHEMLFAYTAAVIAGFILSASQTWTEIRSVNGIPLFVLCASWILARLCKSSKDLAQIA